MIYVARLILVLPWVGIASFAGLLLCLLTPFNPNLPRYVGRMIAFGGLRILNIKVKYENLERLNSKSPCIYISNHQDNLDIFPIGSMVPSRTVSLGKKDILWFPIFGQMYWLSGNILIDRGNKKKAFSSMAKAAKVILEKKVNVWIMPEGTRSKGKGLLPFKKGAFYTAIQAQIPIAPIVLSNYHKGINLSRWNSGTIYIKALEPIETKGLSGDQVQDLLDRAYKTMEDEIAILDQKVEDDLRVNS